MIYREILTKEGLEKLSKDNHADIQLVEKVVRALLLLEGLVEEGLDFVFKGGTALMLHFNSTKRLSIDIDIITSDVANIENVLSKITSKKRFIRFEKKERKAMSAIQKEHYKLHYEAQYREDAGENNILLDILIEEHQYSKLGKLEINSNFILLDGPALEVFVPSIEDLLGDKLTAFAPNTTGIPYQKNEDDMSMEIIKQIYDIGCLFDRSSDLGVVSKTFMSIAEIELKYRNLGNYSPIDVIHDIFQTSLSLATKNQEGNANFKALQNGINRIKQFIFSEKYHIEKAIVDSAKATYVAKLIEYDKTHIAKFNSPDDVAKLEIEQPFYTKLNKLKKSNPEAFFYWYQIYELEKET